jgi:subtilisin family serine protease
LLFTTLLAFNTLAQDNHYFHGKRRVNLETDRTKIILKLPGEDAERMCREAISLYMLLTFDQTVPIIEQLDEQGLVLIDFDRPRYDLERISSCLSTALPVRWVSAGYRTEDGNRVLPSGRVVVRFKSDSGTASQLRFFDLKNATVVRQYSWGTYLVESDSDGVAAARLLGSDKSVVYAEPDFARRLVRRHRPNDPLFDRQWHLENTGQSGGLPGADVRASGAWDLSRGSPDVVIAIVDDGVDRQHEDFEECKFVPGYDFVDDDEDPTEPGPVPFGHGQACAGIAAADGDNGRGVAGLCPGCRIMPIRLLGPTANEYTFTSVVARAFEYAANHGAAVLSNSWGPDTMSSGPVPLSSIEKEAFEYVATHGRGGLGALIVFAAGNDGSLVSWDGYLTHPLSMAVAASNDEDTRSIYSNYGPEIDVAAPSDDPTRETAIWTTDLPGWDGFNFGTAVLGDRRGHYTGRFGGTSAACPLVAGLAGLILSVNPELTADQVRQIITETSDKIDPENGAYDDSGHSLLYGYGRINAEAAVARAIDMSGAGGVGVACTAGCTVEYCVAHEHWGNICSHACNDSSDCPDGFVCAEAITTSGESVRACTFDIDCDVPPREICGDGRDNDGDGLTDEDCPGCGDETYEGRCEDNTVVFCEGEELGVDRIDCSSVGVSCGKDEGAGVFTCLGCGEVPPEGRCDGSTLTWCTPCGILVVRQCLEDCGWVEEWSLYDCTCTDIPPEGRCEGNTAVQCVDGHTIRTTCPESCAKAGDVHECVCFDNRPPRCEGNTLVFCNGGAEDRFECPQECGYLGIAAGCICPDVPFEGICDGSSLTLCQAGLPAAIECPEDCGPDPLFNNNTCLCAGGLGQGETRCQGDDIVYCDRGFTNRRTCKDGCVTLEDPFSPATYNMCGCADATWEGRCDGDDLYYCVDGDIVHTQCPEACEKDELRGIQSCTCRDVPPQGKCIDDVLVSCDGREGMAYESNCAEYEWGCGCDVAKGVFDCLPPGVAGDDSACTGECPFGNIKCGDICVDPDTDPDHCGACDHACVYDHAEGMCQGGICEMGACETGFGNCNDNNADGCEADLNTNMMHCGECAISCGDQQKCEQGKCVSATYRVTGAVRNAKSNDPISKVLLYLGPARETRSASDGTYTFDEVARGEYALVAKADGYKSMEAKVRVTNADVEKDLLLEPKAENETTGCGCATADKSGYSSVLLWLFALATIMQRKTWRRRK